MRYAILIDAGFIKRKLGSFSDPMTADKLVSFTDAVKEHERLQFWFLHRIYYYDAPPYDGIKLKPLSNGEKYDFSSTPLFDQNLSTQRELSRRPLFALRLGELAFRGWRLKPAKLKPSKKEEEIRITSDDLVPDIQQKGVDMKIGLDVASLVLKRQVDAIVLVSGDSDFIPALKLARREGCQVFLVSLGHDIKEELYSHTDEILSLPDIEKDIPTRKRRN